MRIGLDGMPLAQLKTGVGTYTFELACALAAGAPSDTFELVSPLPYQKSLLADAKPTNLELVYSKPNVLKRHWWTIGLPSYIRRAALELFHGTNYEVPMRDGCARVVTIHDLSLLLHSSTHEARAVRRARLRLPVMARTATLVVTVSEQVRAEVCEHLGLRSDKVFAVPLAPRRSFIPMSPDKSLETRRRLGVADEFLLFVGTIEPRKNLWTLVQALEEIVRTTDLRPQLVIAGPMGWKTDEFLMRLRRSPARELVLLTGYLGDADLCALYSSCRVFVYPSIYEGFGLPPLEAMACGAPVIASRVPSVTETTEKVAVLVSHNDVEELARGIIELLRNDAARRSFSAAGMKHAATFSWERTALMTREVYVEALRLRGEKQKSRLQF
jgi:glycosyltransferase involved in cell wall biosynthesis